MPGLQPEVLAVVAVHKRVAGPILIAASTGAAALVCYACVIGALARSRVDGILVAVALLFAVLVLGVWAYGFYRSWQYLRYYGREEDALPAAEDKLAELAGSAVARLSDGSLSVPKPISADTPLLDRRLKLLWFALRQGAPVLSGDTRDFDDRQLRQPEREIRCYTDIVLTGGIAGCIACILIALAQSPASGDGTMLAHLGPGIMSGLAAVIANIGLRICHRTIQNEQDAVRDRVEETITTSFLSHLPREVTSPEDRMAAAAERSILQTEGILTRALTAQHERMQGTLIEQALQTDSLLREHAVLIGQVLTREIQQPIERLASHTAALADHSAAWAAAVAEMKSAHAAFVDLQKEAQRTHEAALAGLFAQHRASLNDFLEMSRQANHVVMVELQEATGRLLQDHGAAAASNLTAFREQFVALLETQAQSHRRVTEESLAAIGRMVDGQMDFAGEKIAATLARVEAELPDAVGHGVTDGLKEAAVLLTALREQAAILAQTVAQVAGTADRQQIAYERWYERASTAQTRLGELLESSQSVNAKLLAHVESAAGDNGARL